MITTINAWHGTNQEFASFDAGRINAASQAGTALMAFFFSAARESAEIYAYHAERRARPLEGEVDVRIAELYRRAGEFDERGYHDKAEELEEKAAELDAMSRQATESGPRVIEAEIRVENAFRIPMNGESLDTNRMAKVLDQARREGHDAVIFEDVVDADLGLARDDHIAVFDPEAISIVGSHMVEAPTLDM